EKVVGKSDTIHFCWVGSWDSDVKGEIQARLDAQPGLAVRIHFVGRQDDTDVYYGGADLFALTSREDPFPCVVLEAMNAGLPVITFSGSGGINSLINEGIGENVPMGDTHSMAQAILRILHNTESRVRMAARARALIRDRFSFRHYVFELLKLCDVTL